MPSMGYVAAAAAGAIIPLAIALPASAGVQSPALHGASYIAGGLQGQNADGPDDNWDNNDGNWDGNWDGNDGNWDGNWDGNNDGNWDGNCDGNWDGNNDGNWDGNWDGNCDGNWDGNRDGNWDEDNGDPDVDVFASGSEASGDASLIVDVNDASPIDEYILTSPALDAGCFSNDLDGAVAETDRFGHLNVTGSAEGCIPGTYLISVSKEGPAEETHYGVVEIY